MTKCHKCANSLKIGALRQAAGESPWRFFYWASGFVGGALGEYKAKHKWGGKSRHERGYGYQWQKLRQVILRRDHHLCQVCMKQGRATPAKEVDHIQPKAQGGQDQQENLQAICKPCHIRKTREENQRNTPSIGVDGWPIDGG